MHPLSGDLSAMTDEELLKNLNNLYVTLKKPVVIRNVYLYQQAMMLLDSYLFEQRRRAEIEREKFDKSKGNFSDRIDI